MPGALDAQGEPASNVEPAKVESELAWPTLGDVLPGRALFPYTLRCLAGALAAVAILYSPYNTPWAICLAAVAAFALFPTRFQSWKKPPRWLGQSSYQERVSEPSQRAQLLLLLGLTLFTRSPQAWLTVLLFAPLVAYRLGSRLWTEVDLDSGQVSHHRTFFGLQITRPGPHLSLAKAVFSGRAVDRPGEKPTYSLAIRLENGSLVNIQSGALDPESSHLAGRRLAHKLDLPHFPIPRDYTLQAARAEKYWEPIPASTPAGKRGPLPWETP